MTLGYSVQCEKLSVKSCHQFACCYCPEYVIHGTKGSITFSEFWHQLMTVEIMVSSVKIKVMALVFRLLLVFNSFGEGTWSLFSSSAFNMSHQHYPNNLQWGFPCARVDVGCGSPVVIYKVGNPIHSEPHLPALWQRLVIQQPKQIKWVIKKQKTKLQNTCSKSHWL